MNAVQCSLRVVGSQNDLFIFMYLYIENKQFVNSLSKLEILDQTESKQAVYSLYYQAMI